MQTSKIPKRFPRKEKNTNKEPKDKENAEFDNEKIAEDKYLQDNKENETETEIINEESSDTSYDSVFFVDSTQNERQPIDSIIFGNLAQNIKEITKNDNENNKEEDIKEEKEEDDQQNESCVNDDIAHEESMDELFSPEKEVEEESLIEDPQVAEEETNEEEEINERAENKNQEEVQNDKENENEFQNILKEFLEFDDEENMKSEIYNQIPRYAHFPIEEICNIENQQNIKYMKEIDLYLHNIHFFHDTKRILFEEELKTKANEFLNNHKLKSKFGSSYTFQTLLIGPEESGKSTFLGILTEQLALELASTGTNKQYFLFPFNFKRSKYITPVLKELYKEFVTQIFTLLIMQSPIYTPFLDVLIQSFCSIVESHAPTLSKKFTLDCDNSILVSNIQQIFNDVNGSWNSPQYFEQWAATIVDLPFSLSRAFGYKDCIYILDHFEYSDITIDGGSSFESCPQPFVKFIAYIIDLHPFLLGCSDTTAAIEALNLGLNSKIEFLPFLDIIDSSLNPSLSFEFTIYFEDSHSQTIKVNDQNCGGLPNYLLKWIDINNEYDKYEKLLEEKQQR